MVDDASAATWSEDNAQEILDQHADRLLYVGITPETWPSAANTFVYRQYDLRARNLEENTSGTTRWRVYDHDGNTVGTADYTVDYVKGVLTFGTNTAGSTYYYDGYSYDLNGAASQAWEERAGMQADAYSFSADGASYSRSEWFKHCLQMSSYYKAQSSGASRAIAIERSDTRAGT